MNPSQGLGFSPRPHPRLPPEQRTRPVLFSGLTGLEIPRA